MKNIFKYGSYFNYSMLNGLYYFGFGIFSCIISIYLAGVGFNATEISLVASASPLFAMVFQPLCGFLADYFKSPKLVTIFTLILTIICGLLFAYTKNLILLFLFNGLTQGFLNGVLTLTDRICLGAPYAYGSIRLWGSLAWAFAAQIGGIILQYFSPILIFYIFAISLLLTIILCFFVKDVKIVEKHEKSISLQLVLKKLWQNKTFVLFTLIFLIFQGPAAANSVYLPLLIQEVGGSTTIVGTSLLLSTLFEIPTILYSDRVVKKISYKNLMLFATMLSFIRYAWYASIPSSTMIVAMFFFQGLTTIIFILIQVKIIIEIVEPQFVNSAYGISSMLGRGVAALVFQLCSGIIIDCFSGITGFTVVYGIMSIMMLLCLVLITKFKFMPYNQ